MRIRPFLLALLALAAFPAGAAADSWSTTAAMSTSRSQHTASLLPNGQVLVAGGLTGSFIVSALDTSERYDPASGQWLRTPSFVDARYGQGASALADGRVLMTGGDFAVFMVRSQMLDSAIAFDPATNTWRRVAGMPHPHGFHGQVTLEDGRVFVFGGFGSTADYGTDGADDHTELYDPTLGAWTIGSDTPYFMANGTTTLLADGRVLVAGGSSSNAYRNASMKYDPTTNRWRDAGTFADGRRYQSATLLPNGKVLIAGGQGDGGRALRTASLYDPATNSWSDAVPMAAARWKATATLLPNGKVLVAGGYDGSTYLRSAELYDPATNSWSPAASMAVGRYEHTATLLQDGRLLVTGGWGRPGASSGALDSAEIYTPDGWPFSRGGGGSGDGGVGTGGGGSGGGTGGGGSGASGTPAISSLALSATRFRAAGSGPSVTAARKRRAPVGTTISYRDGAAATATFVVQRPASGRRSGGRCARPTRANRRKARCTRWVAVGRFRHTDTAGTNSIHFSGRVAGDALLPGSYRLSITARIGRGRASAAKTIGFRIVG